MTTRWRHAILGLGLLLTSLSAARTEVCDQEPYYQGRSLTSWLADFASGRNPDMDRHNDAMAAVQEIGTEALPILMNRILTTSEDLAVVSRSENAQLIQMHRDSCTLSAYRALGPVAYVEIPALIDLLAPQYDKACDPSTEEPDYWFRYRNSELAGEVLAQMGRAAVDPLLKALEDDNPKTRFGVVAVLEHSYWRCRDEQIVSAILKTLHDEDAEVRWVSARVLGAIKTLPENCVPELAGLVRNDPDTSVRSYALMALEKFGPQAKAALPEVLEAVSHENSAVRYYAREALGAIQGTE